MRKVKTEMDPGKHIFIYKIIFILTFLMTSESTVAAEVTVYDAVIPSGRPVTLQAVTKGGFFPEGGKVVEFFADGKRIGRTLSGGDGYAFMKYTPVSPGIKVLKASAGSDADEGTILATRKQDRVILVAIEDTLFTSPYSFNAVPEGRDAILKLQKKFRILYLSTFMDVKRSRKWLRTNGFPLLPVLNWRGADALAELQEQKIKIYALVGPPDMLSGAREIKRKFSFEETEEATVVKDWNELVKRLRTGE